MIPIPSEEPRKSHKRKLPKIISRDEAAKLLAALENGSPEGTRDRLALELMYRAGLRVSEVVNLMPRDVHREGYIDLYAAKGGDGTAYFDPDRVVPLLERWLKIRPLWAGPGARLLCKPNGAPLTTRYLQRLVKKLKDRTGIAGICTPHVLRHSFATELLEDDFTLPEVQAALRHAHLQTTAIYLHVRDKSLQTKMSRRNQPKETR
jgi:integrase/recombinase XerC